ncbi:hypothetical protein [Mammaliicoccus sp. P-M59]|uniref:hypothetical protein n=1 Tax=Mammaliicoccus sp. P-M59 TaxID=2898718 RepID=UPI001EFBBB6D|nr:hypothetical protein [Mammaliicoccus sp. P-M59]
MDILKVIGMSVLAVSVLTTMFAPIFLVMTGEIFYPKKFKLSDLDIKYIKYFAKVRMISGEYESIDYENYKNQSTNGNDYIIDNKVSYSKYNIETVEIVGYGKASLDKYTYYIKTDEKGNILYLANRNAKLIPLLETVEYNVKDNMAIRR